MPGPNGASEGVVLTSGHNFEPGEGADNYLYRSAGGTVRARCAPGYPPFYNRSNDERSGFDAAIVRLDGPLTDAGPSPALYVPAATNWASRSSWWATACAVSAR